MMADWVDDNFQFNIFTLMDENEEYDFQDSALPDDQYDIN